MSTKEASQQINLPLELCIANIPPKQPPTLFKSHPNSLASTAPLPNGEKTLVPFPGHIAPPCQGLPNPRLAHSWKASKIENKNLKSVIVVIPLLTPVTRVQDITNSPIAVRISRQQAEQTTRRLVTIPKLPQGKVIIPRAAGMQFSPQPTCLPALSSSHVIVVTTSKGVDLTK